VSGDVHTPTNAGPDPDGAVPSSVPPPANEFSSDEDERPEVLVGAAFAGGLLTALILRRFARDDD
jgi:hypothetical protein